MDLRHLLATFRPVAGLALMGLASASFAGQASDSVEGGSPEEVDSFRQTHVRFADRMREIDGDTRSYVNLREAEERNKLVGSYDALISALEEDDRGQRVLAIERFERFLERYPNEEYSSHVRFRLADLLFEEATEVWYARFTEYERVMNDPNASLADLERMEEQGEPRRDLSRSVALYEQIIADNLPKAPEDRYERLDGTYVMLGFCYNDQNSLQYDPVKAREAFATLIREVPNSDLADRSQLFLGNFLFADGEFDAAMKEYQAVVDRGVEGKYYMDSLYQLAWARYKLDDFDGALELFEVLLDQSEVMRLERGKESPFAPDARRFMAFSIADISYDGPEAVVVADQYFDKVGDKPYKREVYIDLADVLTRYTRPEEAVAVYERLQEGGDWPNESDNPKHQIQVVSNFSNPLIRDLERAGEERIEFIAKYSEGTPWWEANRNDPEALEVARDYIESSLLDVAIEYRVRAQDSGNPTDFALAAQKYQEYLDKFPISDDYYEQQWGMADSLKLAGDLEGARKEYESLVRSKRYHDYGDASIYSLMDVALRQLSGPTDQPPENKTVAKTVEGRKGPIEVYAISDDRARFVTAADQVLAHPFGPPEISDLPDFREVMKEKGGPLLYRTGQIYHYHNDYPEARRRFELLIEKYPNSIEANYAAGLIVDSYLDEGDLEKVRFYTKKFSQNPPGPPSEIDPERFKGTLEGTTFQLAQSSAEEDPQGAADAFLAFRQEFPRSEFSADALYNAAFYSQKAGKAQRSGELYEQFVREYPNDERSKDLFFRIAGTYEQAFELEKAVDNYRAAMRHPKSTSTEKADAQFNASFLLIGLGRHQEAAEGFESYERDYDAEDQVDVYWLAGEQWEEVSSDRALTFYQTYLRKYPDANPDHTIESYDRMARIYEDRGDARTAQKQRELALAAFDRFARAGKPIGGKGHEVAAAAAYPELEARFATLTKDELSGNETRDTPLLTEKKPAEIKAFEGEVKAFVGRFQNFEYNSGALLMQAKAALYLADLGLSIKCPKGFSEEECWAFDDILQEKVFPQYYEIEEIGIKRISELVGAARDQKKHSRFIDAAYVELNKRRPSDYPAVKTELQGGTDSSAPMPLTPVRKGGAE